LARDQANDLEGAQKRNEKEGAPNGLDAASARRTGVEKKNQEKGQGGLVQYRYQQKERGKKRKGRGKRRPGGEISCEKDGSPYSMRLGETEEVREEASGWGG